MILHDAMMTIHRAKYKLDFLQNEKGEPSGMEYGFLKCCESLAKKCQDDEEQILCWEGKDNFRKKIYPEYKANRTRITDNPLSQLDYDRVDRFKAFLKHKYYNSFIDNYEADDVIASLVDKFKGKRKQIVIYSNDKDMLQLVDDKYNVYVMRSFHDINKSYKWDQKNIRRNLFDLYPCEFPIFLSFIGDKVDNIPGVKGLRKEILANAIKSIRGCSNNTPNNLIQTILDYPTWSTSELFELEGHVQSGAFNRNMELIILRRPDVIIEEPTNNESEIRKWLNYMDFRSLQISYDCGVDEIGDDDEF